MKPSKLEYIVLGLTALLILGTAIFFFFFSDANNAVTVKTGSSPSPSASFQALSPSPDPSPSQAPVSPMPDPSDTGESPSPAPSSGQEDPAPSDKININTANSAALQALPGIGEKRAQAIIDNREENGPFKSVYDLTRVSGIGEGILDQVLDYICVE